jgi:hypothetical protein
VRRPQLGISEAEQEELLASYRALKNNQFRSVADKTEPARNRAVG